MWSKILAESFVHFNIEPTGGSSAHPQHVTACALVGAPNICPRPEY
jgi:hypothetical protein